MTSDAVSPKGLTTVLVLAMAVGFLPWFAISALGPFLVRDLEAGAALPGLLVGVLFGAGACWSRLVGGGIRRWGARNMLLTLFLAAAVSLLVMAVAPNTGWLVAIVVLCGLPIAVPMPASTAMASALLPPARRGPSIGVAQSGQQMGALGAGLFLPPLALAAGWRVALAATALAAVVGFVATTRLPAVVDVRTRGAPGGVGNAASRAPRGLPLFALVMSAWTVGTVAYLPLHGTQQLGFSESLAGGLVTAVGLVAIAGKISWGYLTSRSRSDVAPMLGLALAGAAALVTVAGSTALPGLVWVGAILFGASAISWPVVSLTVLTRRLAPDAVGTASGRVMAAGFIGATIGPIAFGVLVERAGFTVGWLTGALVYATAAVVALASSLRDDGVESRLARQGVRPS